jgi:GT2 family glycosyltransferase
MAENRMAIQPERRGVKQVTVSVVSHLQAALVQALLTDLNRHCHAVINKVVLTCNLPEELPFDTTDFTWPLEVINNQHPLGFGANHNQAFRRCETEWLLVINPDVRIKSDVLSDLLDLATSKTGLLSPQEFDELGNRVENLRGLITPWEVFQRQLLHRPPSPPAQNGWVRGMFMLVRSRAFQNISGFDERYFMYCEDFDLCARLMLHGWDVQHASDIGVVHSWQRQSHGSRMHFKHHIQSLFRMWASRTFWHYRKYLSARPR